MTYIELAIQEAVEKGGYDKYEFKKFVPEYTLGGFVDSEGDGLVYFNELFLDPLFWTALGKARGWVAKCWICGNSKEQGHTPYCARHGWGGRNEPDGVPHYWHAFIDHLLEGKDAESFFALIGGTPQKSKPKSKKK